MLCPLIQSSLSLYIYIKSFRSFLLPQVVPGATALPQYCATKITLSMSIIFSTPAVMCWHTHGMSTFWITLQHCWDGFIFGIPFWTYIAHWATKPCMSPWQSSPTTMLLLLPENRIPVMAKKAKSKMLVLKYIAISLLRYCMCVCVGWFIGVVRDGFYRGFEGKIRMKNLGYVW